MRTHALWLLAMDSRFRIECDIAVTSAASKQPGERRSRRPAAFDVVILGNNDLSQFSGRSQNDDRYQHALIKVHDAALRAGKYYGDAGAQYLTGDKVSADTRFVQNGRTATAGRLRPEGAASPPAQEEPTIGLPGGEQPTGGARRGAGAGK